MLPQYESLNKTNNQLNDEMNKLKGLNRNLNLNLKGVQTKYNILSPQYEELFKKYNRKRK